MSTYICIPYQFEELLRLEVREVLELGVHDAARVPHALFLSACPVAVRLVITRQCKAVQGTPSRRKAADTTDKTDRAELAFSCQFGTAACCAAVYILLHK